MAKAIAKAANRKGVVYALVDNADATFTVYKLCENYDGKVKGGISKQWRYVAGVDRVSEEKARVVYNRRVAA